MKILIIDSDALCWHVFHSRSAITYKGRRVEIIHGFLDYLIDIQSREHADKIVFAWDSRYSKRKKLFSAYKAKREEKRKKYTNKEKAEHKERIKQFIELRTKIIPKLGFKNNYMVDGYEGDDIIASIVREYGKKHLCTIVGRDNDLYQLLSDKCRMYDFYSRKYIDEEVFFNKYGIYPNMWAAVKSIAGCTSDNVPGIKGVGNDTAIKYLLGKLKNTSILLKRIDSSEHIIQQTSELVVLPLKGTPTFKLKKDKCTVKKAKKIAKKYNTNFLLANNFERLFVKWL